MATPKIDDSSVNSQITDSVSQVNAGILGMAPSEAMNLVDLVNAETLGMSMHNAVTAQQNSQTATSASVTATCAKMLQAQMVQTPVIPEPPVVPPPFMPLDGKSAADFVQEATAMAEAAIAMMKSQQGFEKKEQKGLQTLFEKLKKLTHLNGDDSNTTHTSNQNENEDKQEN